MRILVKSTIWEEFNTDSSLEENKGFSTIEIYDENRNLVYENGKSEL